MKSRITIGVLFLSSLIWSCDHIYKEYDKDSFTTLSWKKGDQIIFHPKIEDISKRYELVLGLRHIHGASIRRIEVIVKVISPAGLETERQYSFDVMDDEGESLASCAGNLCDIETVVDENLTFSETGDYQFVIRQNANETVRGIMEFGLIIREASE